MASLLDFVFALAWSTHNVLNSNWNGQKLTEYKRDSSELKRARAHSLAWVHLLARWLTVVYNTLEAQAYSL